MRLVVEQDHQAIGLGIGQRIEQHPVDHGKDGGVRADSYRQRQNSDDGKARRLHHLPGGILQVLEQGPHQYSLVLDPVGRAIEEPVPFP